MRNCTVLWPGVVAGLALMIAGCVEAPARTGDDPPRRELAALHGQTEPVPIEGLDDFFRDLHKLEEGRIEHVRILELGDSHTAGDVFSGRLRERLQERFGNAGRGMMPPGFPFVGLRQKEVTVTQTGHWTVDNSLQRPDDGPYGLSGFVVRSAAAGASISVSPMGPDGFDSATIDYLRGPGGGSFEVLVDGQVIRRVSTNGPTEGGVRLSLRTPSGSHTLEIVARSRGVAITSWSIERRAPGILVDSQGVSGATVTLINRWDPNLVRQDVEALRPSLIILSYGTNEGFRDDLDPKSYAQSFADVLALFRRLAPHASILVVGPPDGQRVDPHCPSRKTAAMACRWETPPLLGTVRQIQRDAARDAGAAFWDWSVVMGQRGGIDRWVRAEPPLARQDHVHFTLQGYQIAADALFDHVMEDYAHFADDGAAQAERPGKSDSQP